MRQSRWRRGPPPDPARRSCRHRADRRTAACCRDPRRPGPRGLADLVADLAATDEPDAVSPGVGRAVQPPRVGRAAARPRGSGWCRVLAASAWSRRSNCRTAARTSPLVACPDQGEVGRSSVASSAARRPSARPGAAARQCSVRTRRGPPRPTARRRSSGSSGPRTPRAQRASPRACRPRAPARRAGTRRRRRRTSPGQQRPCRCAAAPPTPRRRGHDARSGPPCAAADRPPRRSPPATAPR